MFKTIPKVISQRRMMYRLPVARTITGTAVRIPLLVVCMFRLVCGIYRWELTFGSSLWELTQSKVRGGYFARCDSFFINTLLLN